jgi:cyclophilin family peptidyl-prolyl cis-trans isomerase
MVTGPVFRKLGIKSQADLDKRRDEVQKIITALTLKEAYENLGYKFDPKLASRPPKRGTLAMANAGPNTNGSQFFICLADVGLPHAYTIFGNVTDGMDAVDAIAAAPRSGERPLEDCVITSIDITEA